MILDGLKKWIAKRYQKIIKNVVSLSNDKGLSEGYRSLTINNEPTPLRISKGSIDVDGNLYVNGVPVDVDQSITDSSGNIELNADGGTVTIKDDTDSHFLFDCNSTRFRIYDDTNAGDHFTITVAAEGATTLSTQDIDGTSGDLTLSPEGDTYLDGVSTNPVVIQKGGTTFARFEAHHTGSFLRLFENLGAATDDWFEIKCKANGETIIQTYDAAGSDADLIFDVDGDIALDSATGVFIAKNDGTEFSVANSAYAGMILGYTMIGEDAVHSTYTLTSSFAVPDSAMVVTFDAPPSGAVEIMVQIRADLESGRYCQFGLSDNATYNTLGATYEHAHAMFDETDQGLLQHRWVVTGLTPNTKYQYWFGVKTNAGSASYLLWGGTVSGRYPDFIMKAVALPTAISEYAVYD